MKWSTIKFLNTPTRQPIQKILIIDKDFKYQQLNKNITDEMNMEFQRVCCIDDSNEVIKKFIYDDFDLVIISMYFLNLTKSLELIDICVQSNKKVLAVAAWDYTNKINKKLGKSYEAIRGVDFLKKPYNSQQLSMKIKKLAKARKTFDKKKFNKKINELL